MQKTEIRPLGPHEWAVQVTEGQDTTSHLVTVPARLIDDLIDNTGIVDVDEERLVRESFTFLLEREPPGAIKREFDLDEISGYFPEYVGEMRDVLGG